MHETEHTYRIKQDKTGLHISYQTYAPGAANLEALGHLLRAAPDDAILIFGNGKISAVTRKPETARKKQRGGRQNKVL